VLLAGVTDVNGFKDDKAGGLNLLGAWRVFTHTDKHICKYLRTHVCVQRYTHTHTRTHTPHTHARTRAHTHTGCAVAEGRRGVLSWLLSAKAADPAVVCQASGARGVLHLIAERATPAEFESVAAKLPPKVRRFARGLNVAEMRVCACMRRQVIPLL
jgi:hypothetical protein